MRIAVALVCSALMLNLTAQVRLGLRAGATFYTQHMEVTEGYTGANFYDEINYDGVGAAGALMLDIPLAERVFISGEFGYSERGYRLTSSLGDDYTQQVTSGYFGMSLLSKLWVGRGPVKLELLVGGDMAMRLNLRDGTPDGILIMPVGTWEPYPRNGRSRYSADQDYSLVGGAGIVIGDGPVKFHLNIRYMYGLSNVFDREVQFTDLNGIPVGSGSMFNRSFQTSFGFSLPLSRKGWNGPSNETTTP